MDKEDWWAIVHGVTKSSTWHNNSGYNRIKLENESRGECFRYSYLSTTICFPLLPGNIVAFHFPTCFIDTYMGVIKSPIKFRHMIHILWPLWPYHCKLISLSCSSTFINWMQPRCGDPGYRGNPGSIRQVRVLSPWMVERWHGPGGFLGTCNPIQSPSLRHHLATRFSSVQFSHSVMSDSLRPHELQHARPPCPSPTPRVHSDSRPSSQWCHSSHLILCHPLLLLPPIPPSIRVFSNDTMCKTDKLVQTCYIAQGAQLCALWWPRWVGWATGMGRRSKREAIYVYI